MVLSDKAEEILETLWIETEEHKKKSCDASLLLRDDAILKELLNFTLIELRDNQVFLTHKGKEEARNCVRRHRLAERLLADVFDLKKNILHETSCKFEHLLHKGLDENICTLLGHPNTCPHGMPIPEGDCCKDIKRHPTKLVMPLIELEINKKAVISHLHTKERSSLQRLIAMGALPKADIKLLHKFPSYVFQIGKSQFAIDKKLASSIYVKML